MGWTSYYRPKGETDREHLQRELCGTRHTIIDSVTKGTTFYGACRDNETGETFAMVVLQQRGRDGRYAYKAMDETVGPFYYDCPDRILAKLSATDHVIANEWRRQCRERNALRATRVKPKAGDVVRFPMVLTMSTGEATDTFTYTGKGSLFRVEGSPNLARIVGWKNMAYEVITTVDA